MRQYKKQRIGISSFDPDAGKNVESLTAAKKRGIATLQNSKSSSDLLGEEKSDENSGKQSSEMEKSSKNSSDVLGEEKSNENSNKNSSEKEKDDESDGDKSSREEKNNESDGDKSSGEEKSDESEKEEGIESSPNYVKIIFNGTYKFKTHLNVFGSCESRINARIDFGVQFVEFRKIPVAQNIENDFKKSYFDHFLKLDKNVAVQLPMKYDVLTSNIVESVNVMFNEARKFFITVPLNDISKRWLEKFYERQVAYAKLKITLVPSTDIKIMANKNLENKLLVHQIDEDTFGITADNGIAMVHLRSKICPCREFELKFHLLFQFSLIADLEEEENVIKVQ
ncbi:hypothetical protein H5410_040062 [Solanum commersonii]|uniref:Uncharacterized protein n=1 Tax=Solanum commersonii TaxID=4109 RepID=A0A9J5XQA5_SOLCO|nr:hypothetical protein H5410_040062 [Solanum commersonii]